MYKKYIFKNVWHVLLFLLFGQPSIVVVRPALNVGRTLSLTVSFLIYFFHLFRYFFFFCRDGVFSFPPRENRWPSHFFFSSSVSRPGRSGEGGAPSPSSQAPHPGSVYIHSKLYMLVFFFFQIKVHELYHVLCPFSNYCAKFYIRAA